MGLLDTFLQKRLDKASDAITKKVAGEVVTHLDEQINKTRSSSGLMMSGAVASTGVKRYQFSQDMVNGGIQRKTKPGANITFETMRMFSIQHEVTRACVNFRKRQISGMEWDVVAADKNDKTINEAQRNEIKQFFKNLGGRGIGYREFMNRFVEDLMVIDAVSLEKQKNRGGGLFNLIPIDAATIRLRVDENGATPEPPETAYVQVIRGQVTAEFTDDEMLYEIMNPRNDTPYGLAPLESLMITVTSSLKAGMYNLAYLTDGNIPEGFYTMPENWQPQQIKDFQDYFDALMSGNDGANRRLKFMPQGTYSPTTKPTDMAFEQFNDWLMKLTCAVFDINPIDIGFAPKGGLGGKGFAEMQEQGTEDKGKRPLALFIEEIATKIIQEDLGFPNLRFDFPELRAKDAATQATTNAALINSGQRTIDEIRTDEGLAPLPDGAGAKAFVSGQITFIDEESRLASQNAQSVASSQQQSQGTTQGADGEQGKETPPPAKDDSAAKSIGGDRDLSPDNTINLRKKQIEELRTFRKYAVNRLKAEKSIRPFVSAILPLETVEDLNSHVLKSNDVSEIRKAFEEPIKDLEMLNIDTALEARNRVLNIV